MGHPTGTAKFGGALGVAELKGVDMVVNATEEPIASHQAAGDSVRSGAAARPASRELDRIDLKKIAAARAAGDEHAAKEAFRPIVERYNQRAYSIAMGVLNSPSDAEDVVQESFVKAYLSLDDFKGNSSFYTWFYRIVVNMSVDLRRRIARQRTVSLGNMGQESATLGGPGSAGADRLEQFANADGISTGYVEDPQVAVERQEQREILQRELAQISDEHRAVIMLRDVEGLSYEEIADVIGVSKGTVMSRLFYARKRLQVGLRGLFQTLSE